VAAAARREGSDGALSDVKRKLADLSRQCRPPSQLERNIVKFESGVTGVGQAIERLQDTLSPSVRKAVRSRYQRLEDSMDAFRDYVRKQRGREDHDHVIGRVMVGEFVRQSLDDIIDYFDRL
jgi:hypothetical protein